MVYVASIDEHLYAIELETGKEKWKYHGVRLKRPPQSTTAPSSSAIWTERFIASTQFKISGPINGAPAVVDGKTFVAGCDRMLHVIEVDKGKELRSVNLDGQVGATAAVVDDRVYVGTLGNELLAIDWQKGEVVWRFVPPKHQAFYSSTTVTDDLVIVGCCDRRIWAIDRKTGKQDLGCLPQKGGRANVRGLDWS